MPNSLPDSIFREMISKLRAAGLPDRQAQSFAEECFGYRDLNRPSFKLSDNGQLPSDDCFRTLAEAQRIFASIPQTCAYSRELDLVDQYLKVPYSNVLAAKRVMSAAFGKDKADIELIYAQDPEWLLVSVDSVKDYSDFLSTRFADPELSWGIFRNAAFLGLEKTAQRINAVLELLGPEHGEATIREDVRGYAWLYYRWYTDPIGCIEYMLQCGLTPDRIPEILKLEPTLLYAYKEIHTWDYYHDQQYIDRTIQKYLN